MPQVLRLWEKTLVREVVGSNTGLINKIGLRSPLAPLST